MSGTISLGATAAIFTARYVREHDALSRSQIKWIALGFAIGVLPLVGLTQLPIAIGIPPLAPERWTILTTGFIPLGFAFAITRYRLLDIGSLMDNFIVYLTVLILLGGVEAGLLGWIDAIMTHDPATHRMVFVSTMILLVLLYAPIRVWVAQLLATILGRRRPPAESAVESLLERAHLLGDAHAALEQTIAWMLRPGSIRWLRPGEGNDHSLCELSAIHSCLGQDLPGVPEADAAALLVSVREGGRTSAMILVPANGMGWRRADRDLAMLVARAAEPLLESQALKHEREALQREMHDGLGNQLYGLNLLSQNALSVSREVLCRRMERIQSTTKDAIDSLRTGLTILSQPTGAFGPALATLL